MRIDFVQKSQGQVVQEFTQGEDRGTEEQTQEPSDLAEETEELKRDVLLNGLEAQLLVIHIHVNEVLPAKTVKEMNGDLENSHASEQREINFASKQILYSKAFPRL